MLETNYIQQLTTAFQSAFRASTRFSSCLEVWAQVGFVSKMAFLAISSECQSIQGNFWNDQVHLTAFKCQIHDKVILHSQVGPLGVSRLNHPDMSPNASGENQCSPLQLSGGDLLIMSALLYSDLQSKKHRTLFTVMYHVIMSNTM